MDVTILLSQIFSKGNRDLDDTRLDRSELRANELHHALLFKVHTNTSFEIRISNLK